MVSKIWEQEEPLRSLKKRILLSHPKLIILFTIWTLYSNNELMRIEEQFLHYNPTRVPALDLGHLPPSSWVVTVCLLHQTLKAEKQMDPPLA